MGIAQWIVDMVTAYGVVGGAVATVFLIWGVDRIVPDIRESFIVRPLLAPGVIVLWPLVLWRWFLLEQAKRRSDAAEGRRSQ